MQSSSYTATYLSPDSHNVEHAGVEELGHNKLVVKLTVLLERVGLDAPDIPWCGAVKHIHKRGKLTTERV